MKYVEIAFEDNFLYLLSSINTWNVSTLQVTLYSDVARKNINITVVNIIITNSEQKQCI